MVFGPVRKFEEANAFWVKWVWVKIKPPGDRRFSSLVPFTRVPFWGYPIFDPQPNREFEGPGLDA